MTAWELAGIVAGVFCFAIWLPSMIIWIRHGVSIPRYIHVLATVSTCIGVSCPIGFWSAGMITLKPSIALVVLPPSLIYFGWFWMFGPEWSRQLENAVFKR